MTGAQPAWSWDDYRALLGEPPDPTPRRLVIGGSKRPHGGAFSRFAGTSHHADRRAAALGAEHAALRENRTLFPRSVVEADQAPRLLVSGHNSAKLGARVMRGPWRGMPIYQLTLEERATCPRSCALLSECFGNAMPFARRHKHGDALEDRLNRELFDLARRHPGGFVVRLHVLGDFYSADYAAGWVWCCELLPQLHVFGYTAHPADSEIGSILAEANTRLPERWCIRSSVAAETPTAPYQATTIWRQARGRVPEGIVCPAQTGDTAGCGSCGLCWSPSASTQRIAFIGHGMRGRPRRLPLATHNPMPAEPAFESGTP